LTYKVYIARLGSSGTWHHLHSNIHHNKNLKSHNLCVVLLGEWHPTIKNGKINQLYHINTSCLKVYLLVNFTQLMKHYVNLLVTSSFPPTHWNNNEAEISQCQAHQFFKICNENLGCVLHFILGSECVHTTSTFCCDEHLQQHKITRKLKRKN
jgi:hypothetical protein